MYFRRHPDNCISDADRSHYPHNGFIHELEIINNTNVSQSFCYDEHLTRVLYSIVRAPHTANGITPILPGEIIDLFSKMRQ